MGVVGWRQRLPDTTPLPTDDGTTVLASDADDEIAVLRRALRESRSLIEDFTRQASEQITQLRAIHAEAYRASRVLQTLRPGCALCHIPLANLPEGILRREPHGDHSVCQECYKDLLRDGIDCHEYERRRILADRAEEVEEVAA